MIDDTITNQMITLDGLKDFAKRIPTLGNSNNAAGNNAMAIGDHIEVGNNALSIGTYNSPVEGASLIIGNGDSENNRKNILWLKDKILYLGDSSDNTAEIVQAGNKKILTKNGYLAGRFITDESDGIQLLIPKKSSTHTIWINYATRWEAGEEAAQVPQRYYFGCGTGGDSPNGSEKNVHFELGGIRLHGYNEKCVLEGYIGGEQDIKTNDYVSFLSLPAGWYSFFVVIESETGTSSTPIKTTIVSWNTYFDKTQLCNFESNYAISKYQISFQKGYTSPYNYELEFKRISSGTYRLSDNSSPLVGFLSSIEIRIHNGSDTDISFKNNPIITSAKVYAMPLLSLPIQY